MAALTLPTRTGSRSSRRWARKMAALFLAELPGHAGDGGVEFLGDRRAGALEAANLPGHGGRVHLLRPANARTLIEAIGAGNGHARRERSLFS